MAKLRVAKVRTAIAQELNKMLLHDVKDPRINRLSVTGVDLSDDMSYAKVYIGLYGPAQTQEEAWQALNSALGYLRTELAKRIRLRLAPELVLVRDQSVEYADHIENLIKQIKEQDAAKAAAKENADGREL